MAVVIWPATPADAYDLAYVRITTWRAAYAGLIPKDYLLALNVDHETLRWRENLGQLEASGLCGFMAVDQPDKRVVGYAIAGPERSGDQEFTGELYALYVLPDFQNQGTGRALVKAVAGWMRERGHQRMIIYVLGGNMRGRRFYEAIGGRLAREKAVEIAGHEMTEVGYGYEIAAL